MKVNEKEDMTTPRCAWGEGFSHRCVGEHSQRHLEGSRQKGVCRLKWAMGRREREEEKRKGGGRTQRMHGNQERACSKHGEVG